MMMMLMLTLLLMFVMTSATNVEMLSVYHMNPQSAGAIPLNMDTGDTLGDLYFYLGQFLLPVEVRFSISIFL